MDTNHWIKTEKGLYRELPFKTFSDLTRFLAELGPYADRRDHHPDLCVRRAVLLDVYLMTHDKKRITEKDEDLAAEIDRLYANY